MEDSEWLRFLAWWKAQWSMSAPHRMSIEMYLKWKEESTPPIKEEREEVSHNTRMVL